MAPIIEGPPGEDEPKAPVWRRLLWFVALAALGLGVTAGAAYGLRALVM